MRFPNLRYGNPIELQHYAQGIPLEALSRELRRDKRTVRAWLTGRQRVPFWVPELMRLRQFEAWERHRQMGMRTPLASVTDIRSRCRSMSSEDLGRRTCV